MGSDIENEELRIWETSKPTMLELISFINIRLDTEKLYLPFFLDETA